MGSFRTDILSYLLVSWLAAVCCESSANQEWNNPAMSQTYSEVSQRSSNPVDNQVSNLIATSALNFAHSIGLQLTESTDNVRSEVFSPVSVMSALALLMLGAKGKSYEELKQLFNLNYDPTLFHEHFGYMLKDVQQSDINKLYKQWESPSWRKTLPKNAFRRPSLKEQNDQFEYVVKVANGVFTKRDFNLNPDYRQIVLSVYQSDLQQLDFYSSPAQARYFINDWVSRNTFGKIPNIISGEISKNTNVIVASALYFKAFWENSFFELATDLDYFYPDGLQQPPIKVKMMATGGIYPFYDAKEFDCRIIGLPYKGNLTTMYVIQPNNSSRSKLAMLQRTLSADKIELMISKMVQTSALLAFPKLKFSRSHSMKNILSRLGVNQLFTSGASDLSLIGGALKSQTTELSSNAAVMNNQRIQLNNTTPHRNELLDRFEEPPLFFSRFGEINSQNKQISNLNSLETSRRSQTVNNPDIFVEDILHKVVFDLNEHGTEAAAATLAVLYRSGTDLLFRAESPFILLIRHDLTKLPLFYGIINEPVLT